MPPENEKLKLQNHFNAMINKDRERKKAQDLAQQIFGSKGRRSSAPGVANRKPGTGPSLASRIGNGISKQRNSAISVGPQGKSGRLQAGRPVGGNVDADWTHDLHSQNNPSSLPRQNNRFRPYLANHLHSALHNSASSPALNSQFNVVAPTKPSISIRGLAGPYTVLAKNFAVGTTAADIESAMTPVGGVATECRVIAERPVVIAEITFETKEGADNIVDTHTQADGNILHVYHKVGGLVSRTPTAPPAAPTGPRSNGTSQNFNNSTGRYRDYESRAEIIDGSYGFDDRIDEHNRDGNSGKPDLYSDRLVNKRGQGHSQDRGRGSGRGY
ncbi:hypothetical protein BJ878DRAFT_272938 [Calycina marina]|uniref:RRM domain-containing protein n=1 Tax=Calycina marina TaxID=1763456 RepID=A0A9P8CH81_9HELO|nr:hypothetical protein BJ878DRAFT_272938 [Calycina marina]